MDVQQKVLFVDAGTGYYRVAKYPVGDFFGPVDLGLHLTGRFNSLNIGVGLLAGSILPGSNRLIVTGFSPCWGGFYVSSMGGAGLVFDNLGINMLSLVGCAARPSVLILNRQNGEEIDVSLEPVDLTRVWASGRLGVYAVLDHVHERFTARYAQAPRILAVGPAAEATDFGAIVSVPIDGNGKLTDVDTWAGRGGFGSRMLHEHNIAAVIYGGTVVDEDFRDRKVADEWFQVRFQKRLAAKDFEATTKYRFDPRLSTGGTLGANFATLGGAMLSFNYRSIYMSESERVDLHRTLVLEHYLKQFNEETIDARQQHTCGEPCSAVCKKMRGEFKKDYEPYETMGPQCGIFDQRAAERLAHRADTLGFDAIAAGGVLSWLFECVHEGVLTPDDVGATEKPVFTPDGFRVVEDSAHNADLGVAMLDAIVSRHVDLLQGPRRRARRLARVKGRQVLDLFVHAAFARKGWMVPNQYWTPGALAPMPIMGKYYMYYGPDFLPPRQLGRMNAERLVQELLMDNLGICRFHRGWAEEMGEEIVQALYGLGKEFVEKVKLTAGRINSRNASVFWEAGRNADLVYEFLRRRRDVGHVERPELADWLSRFEKDRREAALDFWYEMHKGTHESLLEF
ncbi:MAG TPA: aldehyde ferredoxin oxidoreductase N-terminal domain-containing protein [Vicinamibacterales bacterium]